MVMEDNIVWLDHNELHVNIITSIFLLFLTLSNFKDFQADIETLQPQAMFERCKLNNFHVRFLLWASNVSIFR